MDKSKFVFSYGTLSNKKALKKLCNKNKELIHASLDGYIKISDETPYYCIEPKKGASIKGTLFEVSEQDIMLIDRWESVPLYTKQIMKVKNLKTNKFVDAIVYNKTPIGKTKPANEKSLSKESMDKIIESMPSYSEKLYDVFFIQPFITSKNENDSYKQDDFLRLIEEYQMKPDENYYNEKFIKNWDEVIDDEPKLKSFKGQIKKTIKLRFKFGDDVENCYLTIKTVDSDIWNNLYLFYFEFINVCTDPKKILNCINEHKLVDLISINNDPIRSIVENKLVESISRGYFFINSSKNLSADDKKMLFMKRVRSLSLPISSEFNDSIDKNLAFYNSAKIFGHSNVLIEEAKNFDSDFEKRMLSQFYTLFIYEILILEDTTQVIYKHILRDFFDEVYEKKYNIYYSESKYKDILELENKFIIANQKLDYRNLFKWEASLAISKNLFENMIFKTNSSINLSIKNDFDIINNKFNQIIVEIKSNRSKNSSAIFTLLITLLSLLVSSNVIVDFLTQNEKISKATINSVIFWIAISIISLIIIFIATYSIIISYLKKHPNTILFNKSKDKSKKKKN